ncbi:MAG: hypothetical protein K2Q45_07095 [Nitrosomonas sp.]|nr:hypothetical protein [Nitrosomonas sp.]
MEEEEVPSSQLLLLSGESLMNLLRAAYEMNDDSHMSTLMQMLSSYTVSKILLHQLIEHLVIPERQSVLLQDINRLQTDLAELREESDCFKSHFIFYATSLCHLYYVKRDARTGVYTLHSKSNPVFYSHPNIAVSYIWLTTNQYGMLAHVQHFACDVWLPRTLLIHVHRSTEAGDMLPLQHEILIPTSGSVACKMKFKANVGKNAERLMLLECSAVLPFMKPFVLLITAGDHYTYIGTYLISFKCDEPLCEVKPLPVALHMK